MAYIAGSSWSMAEGRSKQRSLVDITSGSLTKSDKVAEINQISGSGSTSGVVTLGLTEETDLIFGGLSDDGSDFLKAGARNNGGGDIGYSTDSNIAAINNDIAIAGGNGVLLISRDAGETWASHETNLTSSTNRIFVDTNNWIIADGNGQVWYISSLDDIANWTLVGKPTTFSSSIQAGVEANGVWYFAYNSIGLSDSGITYTSDITDLDSYTTLQGLFPDPRGEFPAVHSIASDGSTFAVSIGGDSASGSSSFNLFSSDDPTDASSWTLRHTLGRTATSGSSTIATDGTTWVFAGNVSSRERFYTTTDPTQTSAWSLNFNYTGDAFGQISSLVHNGGAWVAVIRDSISSPGVYYTDDPTGNWTKTLSAVFPPHLVSVVASAGNWVVAGTLASVYKTATPETDGSWVLKNQHPVKSIYASAASGSIRIIAGQSGDIYSVDANGDTTFVVSKGGLFTDIATDGTNWVAVGYPSSQYSSGYIYTSTDPTSSTGWILEGTFSGAAFRKVATDGNDTWVAVGYNGRIVTSSSTTNWGQVQDINIGYDYSVTTDGTTWIIGGEGRIYSSTDPTAGGFTQVTSIGNRFLAAHTDGTTWLLGGRDGQLYSSTDPTSSTGWSLVKDFGFGKDILDIKENSGFWIISTGNELYKSVDPTSSTGWVLLDTLGDKIQTISINSSNEWLAIGLDQASAYFTVTSGLTNFSIDLGSATVTGVITASSTSNQMAAQVRAKLIAAAATNTAIAAGTNNTVEVDRTTKGEIADITVTLESGNNSTATASVVIRVQGTNDTGTLTTVTATASSENHTPSTTSFTIPSGSSLSSFLSTVRNAIDNNLGGYSVGALVNSSFLATSDTLGVEAPDLTVVITTAGTGSDLSISNTVTRQGASVPLLDITATISGGGLTTPITVGPSSTITSTELNSAIDTAVLADSSVTIADDSEGRVITSASKRQYPELSLSVNNAFTSSLATDIRTLLFGN